MRHAWELIWATVAEPPSRASCCACAAVIDGPWTTRFNESSRELKEDVLHRLGALLPDGKLGVDPQAVGTGEAGAAALLANEVDYLAAVDRRVLHELQLHRFVRGIDAQDAERPRRQPHLVTVHERARRVG